MDGFENSTNRLRAENYTLKLQIEELKAAKAVDSNDAASTDNLKSKKENKLIFEDIKFDDVIDNDNKENKENDSKDDNCIKNSGGCKTKKSVTIASKVDVIDNDEKMDVKTKDGGDGVGNRLKEKSAENKSKHQPKMNKVIQVDDDGNQNECNTQ